ncbi:MAG TPA: DUF3787 domain-containing protein [Candidatus Avimonas sp.]|nr:DUF3787 domain-containing protein [Clostridiales bacterium]HPU57916.1 DUF3787 domain-containing protein [Candidatus Avimonas sp.]
MQHYRYKDKDQRRPVECHNTAAWANIKTRKKVSQVHIPDELQVLNAKQYVDSNEK